MVALAVSRRTRNSLWLYPSASAAILLILILPTKFAIAAIFAAVAAAVVLSRPWWGIAFLTVFLPFNNVGSQLLGRTTTATAFGAIKDGILALLLLAAFNRRTIRADVAIPALLVAAFGLVGFGYATSLSTALYGWRNDYEPILLLLAVPALLTVTQADKVRTLIAVMGQVAAAIGILTWSRGVSWLVTIHLLPAPLSTYPFQLFSTGNSHPRAFSPLAAPNEFGAYLDVALAVIVTRTDWSIRRRAMMSVLPVAAIYLARSRSALIGIALLASVVAVRVSWHRFGSAAGLGLATAAGLVSVVLIVQFLHSGGLSTSYDASLAGHASSVQAGIRNAITHPLGFGLGNVGPRALLTSSNAVLVESFWLLQTLESGFLVLFAFLFALWRLVNICIHGGDRAFLGVACLAAIVTSQLVLPTMQDGPVSFTFWMVMGIAVCFTAPRTHSNRPSARNASNMAGAIRST